MEKQQYELTIIYAPGADEEATARETVEAVIKKTGAEIAAVEEWGERSMTYPIEKYERGIYIGYQLTATTKQAKQVNERLRIEKGVLRYLLIKSKPASQEKVSEE